MAYFNHAFQKLMLALDGSNGGANPLLTAGGSSTLALEPGQLGVFAAQTTGTYNANQSVSLAAAYGGTIQELPMVYIAQGSINTKDKLGPFAGGYQETVKSKGVNPKYVTKFYRQDPIAAQAEIITVNMCNWPSVAPQCGTSYYLRIDVKGSPALRFLTHNLYKTYGSTNVCCPADPNASTDIDPMYVLSSWAYQIARDPLMSQFVAPTLTWQDGGSSSFDVVAWYAANPTLLDTDLYAEIQNSGSTFLSGNAWSISSSTDPALVVTGAYVDTQFGTCSFHPQDFYELAPVKLYPSITDQNGDPCVNQIFCPTDGLTPATQKTQEAAQGSGYGQRYIRDLILFRRYMQENYVYDPRLREVMDQDVITNSGIGFNTQYIEVGLLHSVPRFNNPSGVFDNDQYLVTVVFPNTVAGQTDAALFTDWMDGYLVAAGNGVQLELV